jgi:peptide/nickel transport system substrate-binding protein
VQYSGDGRTVTVRLRPDLVFHDGSRLDAATVQASFERIVRLGVSPLAADLRDVGVAASADGATVTFTLPEPNHEFARLTLANPYASIVSRRVDESSDAFGFVSCTGPYRFVPELYEPGVSLTLQRWPAYTGPAAYADNPGPARIPELRFSFLSGRDERWRRLVDGRGCVLSLGGDQMVAALEYPRLRLHDAAGGVTYVGFNFQRKTWQDRRMRRAVALALDRRALAAGGPFLAADTPLPPSAIGHDADLARYGVEHSPALARTLLEGAGFDATEEIVLLIPESNTYAEMAQTVVAQLANAGMGNVRVRAVPRADILEQRQDFDLLLFDYAWGDYTALRIFLGPGPRNLLGYPNDDVAALVTEALSTADRSARRELVQRAQRVVLEEVLWQPLVTRRIVFAVDGECLLGERQSPWGELIYHDAVTR